MLPATLETILIEEIPASDHYHHPASASLLPSSIYEQDDPRSLIYLLDSDPLEDAVAALAEEKRRRQQQQLEEARLERMMIEEDMLLDALGRRLLAVQGLAVPDIWNEALFFPGQPGSSLPPFVTPSVATTRLASGSGTTAGAGGRGLTLASTSSYGHSPYHGHAFGADPFVHMAPVILTSDRRPSFKEDPTLRKIAVHPVTGQPVLFTGQADFYSESNEDDDFDLDWLGRELLLRGRGAGVWVIDTDAVDEGSAEPVSFEVIECEQPCDIHGSGAAVYQKKQSSPLQTMTRTTARNKRGSARS